MHSNKWEIEEAMNALRSRQYSLVHRYLEKALECVRCMYCHGWLDDKKSYSSHFKGYVHDECKENYSGRIDYENKKRDELISALDDYWNSDDPSTEDTRAILHLSHEVDPCLITDQQKDMIAPLMGILYPHTIGGNE